VNADTRVLLSEGVEVLLEKNILGSNVGKDEVDLGLVSGSSAANDGADDLEHGSDSSTASNHTKVSNHIGSIDKGALGATDLDGLTDGERGHVLGDVALRIRLDQEVDVAGLVVTRDGSVGTNNLLGSAVGLGARSAN
jgi:hypothetical protein